MTLLQDKLTIFRPKIILVVFGQTKVPEEIEHTSLYIEVPLKFR